MKLIRCYISSFGKIKDFSYDFTDGLNEIKQDNGWGKSTLATFIRVMLYGINGSSPSIEKNIRKKFTPWNSEGTFGGYLIIEAKKMTLKIERYFGKTVASDTIKITDANTGKAYFNTDDIGRRIFDIDEEGFLYTTYFSQDNLESKSNSTLTAKYNSICEIDEKGSLDDVIKNLDDKIKPYSYSGNRGFIPNIKSEILDLEEQIITSNMSEKRLFNIAEEIKNIESEIDALEMSEKILDDKMQKANRVEGIRYKKARYDSLSSEKDQILGVLEKNLRVLNGVQVNEEQLKVYGDCVGDLRKNQTAVQTLKGVYNESKTTEKSMSKPILSAKIIYIISAIFLALGAGGFFINLILGIALTAVSMIVFALSFFITSSINSNSNKNENDGIKAQIETHEQIIAKYVEQIDSFLSQFNLPSDLMEYEQSFAYIKSALERQIEQQKNIAKIDDELKQLSSDKDIFAVVETVENADKIRAKLDDVRLNLKNARERLANSKNSYTRNEEIFDKLSDLRAEKEQKIAMQKEYEQELKILTYTRDFLKKANENLKLNYRKPLLESLNKYYSLVTNDQKTVEIDVDFNLSVEEKGGQKDTAYYSKGYRDLFEVCRRFALLDVLFKDEKPFMILDDPFANFDKNKIEKAINLLKQLQNEYQIIYLVCHDSRSII